MDTSIFSGCIPALMTPCKADRTPDFDALVKKGKQMMDAGMNGVVYCGSMGDWPLLTDDQRKQGVAQHSGNQCNWQQILSRQCTLEAGQGRQEKMPRDRELCCEHGERSYYLIAAYLAKVQ